ncbi:MAG: single-stranded DNA-binding protein [Alkalispirochaeta sp.]
MNSVQLVGRLVRDSETKYSRTGNAILSFSLAVNERQKQGDSWQDVAHYFDCTLFGRQAESLGQYLVKGKQVGIEGKLEQQRWQTQDGQNRSKVAVVARHVDLLGGDTGQRGPAPMQDTRTPQPRDTQQQGLAFAGSGTADTGDEFPDDIPF